MVVSFDAYCLEYDVEAPPLFLLTFGVGSKTGVEPKGASAARIFPSRFDAVS